MSYERREYPDFSWSYSRNEKFQECPRDYYYHYYGSHNGWEFEAPEEARLTYRLKNLTSLPLEVGAAVHEGAAAAIHTARSGGAALTVDDLYGLARNRLNKAWLDSKDFDEWERSPKWRRMFHEFYYDTGIGETPRERAKDQLRTCFRNLLTSESYQEAVAAPRCEIKRVEEFITFNVEGTDIHAVPDLIYRSGDDFWKVVDWKSGRHIEDDSRQACVYALYVREHYGAPAENIGVRVENLFRGSTKEYSFSEEELDDCADSIVNSVAAMQTYLRDAEQNAPLNKASFPMREDTSRCRFCNFYQLDRKEIATLKPGPF